MRSLCWYLQDHSLMYARRFRWAACQIDTLSTCLSPKKLFEALDALPVTLDETYDRILSNIDPCYQTEVHQILQWLTCSLRPLTLQEVAELIAIDMTQDQPFDFEKRTSYIEDVMEICGSLITCLDTDDESFDRYDDTSEDESNGEATKNSSKRIVRLAHCSVKEYMVSKRIRSSSQSKFSIDEASSHSAIGRASLAYLLLYDESSYTSSESFRRKMPLAKYSAKYWSQYLIRGNDGLAPEAKKLFLARNEFQNWI